MRFGLPWVLISVAVAAGCNNPCQRVCARMADYAEECGYDVSSSEIGDCISSQAGIEKQDIEQCRDFGDAQSIRLEWTCDDLDAYWSTDG